MIDHVQKAAQDKFRSYYARLQQINYDMPDAVFGYQRRRIMQFALKTWEPQLFKAETQAAAIALGEVVAYAFSLPPVIAQPVIVLLGYGVGFITVKPEE